MTPAPVADPDAAEAFILKLARALHEAGAPAPRLEDVMTVIAPRLGLEGQFFSTPTSIFASFGPVGRQRTALVRVEPSGLDLGRLAVLDALIEDLARGAVGPDEAIRRLDAMANTPAPYGRGITLACYALASAATARFFDGGPAEIGVAAVVGLVTGLLLGRAQSSTAFSRALEPLAAIAASLLALAATRVVGSYATPIAALAGIIVLLPGLTMMLAMNELASRHLVAGTARLAGVSMTFLGLGFGFALGGKLGQLLFPGALAGQPMPLPSWTLWVALAIFPVALTVLFRARFRDAPAILVVGSIGFVVARFTSGALGAELAMFVSALAVAIASNVYTRLQLGPSAVPLVPGMLPLVPGSLGLRSIMLMFDKDVASGIELGFRVVLLGVALTGGLLFANLAVPPRRTL